MAHTPEISNGNGDQIKLGTTGTVSSLMSRELESVKQSAQAFPSSGKKLQDPPVSVPCGYSPKRTHLRKNPPNDPGSNSSSSSSNSNSGSSSSSNSGSKSSADTQMPKPKPRRNEHKAPMLAATEITLEKNTSKEKPEKKKKGHTYIAEVVDIKCNNPMSSRLKKLGFSKLSESIV